MTTADTVQAILPQVEQVLAACLKNSGAGIVGRISEASAVVGYLNSAKETFPGNEIIAELTSRMGIGELRESLAKIDLDHLNVSDVLDSLDGLNLTLPMGEQGTQIKQFILGVANAVAGAAGPGVLGGGEKIEPQEQDFLDSLRLKLGL
jgi:hypothetical protein